MHKEVSSYCCFPSALGWVASSTAVPVCAFSPDHSIREHEGHGWDQHCVCSLQGRLSKRSFSQNFLFHENHPQGFTELCVRACVFGDTGRVFPL